MEPKKPYIKTGQRIRVVGNHPFSGHCGIIEDIESKTVKLSVKLDNGTRVILHPKNYELE